MANYIFTTNVTTLGSAQNPSGGDTILVTDTGNVLAPSQSIVAADPLTSGVTVQIAGLLQIGSIWLNGGDTINLAATGTLIANGISPGIFTDDLFGASFISNAGTIQAGSRAIAATGTYDMVRNTGLILGQEGVVLGAVGGPGGQSLINAGRIDTIGFAVLTYSDQTRLTNSGEITTRDAAAVIYDQNAANAEAALFNTGTIRSNATYGIAVSMDVASQYMLLENTGTISGRGYAYYSSGLSTDNVTNAGTMIGAVDLGAGDDLFFGQGGHVTGSLFMGAGHDAVDLRQSTLGGYAYGGSGNDVYWVDDAALVIYETDSEIDSVFAETSYRLQANVESLVLLEGGNWNAAGNAGANALAGNSGDNRITGLDGLDTLNGDLGDDRLFGGNQADVLSGDEGQDELTGGLGNDTLNGGDGDDRLTGGANKDQLTGNAGADLFIFANPAHSTVASNDVITDFTQGDDRIDLSAIDAIRGNALANDGFAFIGSAGFGSVAGQLRFYQSAGATFVEMDVNGDSISDGTIRLTGTLTLTAGDFVL